MSAGEFNDLCDLCLGNFVGENSADTDAVAMNLKHDMYRLVAPFVEKAFQYMHDELHWRVVVVQQQHLVQTRPLRFRPRLCNHVGTDAAVLAPMAQIILFFAHRRMFKRAPSPRRVP